MEDKQLQEAWNKRLNEATVDGSIQSFYDDLSALETPSRYKPFFLLKAARLLGDDRMVDVHQKELRQVLLLAKEARNGISPEDTMAQYRSGHALLEDSGGLGEALSETIRQLTKSAIACANNPKSKMVSARLAALLNALYDCLSVLLSIDADITVLTSCPDLAEFLASLEVKTGITPYKRERIASCARAFNGLTPEQRRRIDRWKSWKEGPQGNLL